MDVASSISGLFYYQLGNIDPKYRSTLHTIQLLAVVKCAYIEKYGMNIILEPMMEAVKELETVRSFSTLHCVSVGAAWQLALTSKRR